MTIRVISEGVTHEFPDGAKITIESPEYHAIDLEQLAKDLEALTAKLNEHFNETPLHTMTPLSPIPASRGQRFKWWLRKLFRLNRKIKSSRIQIP